MYTVLHRGTSNIAGQLMASSPKQAKEKIAEKLGLQTTAYLMATKSSQVRMNPAKKTVSQKISQLVHEGYPQKQAVAVALSEKRAGKVKMNPMNEMREFTVIKWKRGKNTTNGNPVYEFILKDEFGGMHTGKTKPNAGWVYSISSVYEGDKINAALEETKSGRVYMIDYGKRKSNPIVPNENFDYVMIQDIKFVAENDANLYRRQGRPIVENLAKKMAKGTFDAAKAVKLYEYLADSAVKDYSVSQLGKRTPTLTILSKPERQVLAQQLFESYADEIKDAAQEIIAKSGKKTTRTNPSKRTSSRSAVVPNPVKKRTYTVYCQVDGQSINNWTKLATFYSATKATQYAKAYAKQYPKHYVRVESHG
jgi:hypothetical protein